MAFQYFDAAGAVTADGVFIPIAVLPGLSAAELAAAAAAELKEGKTVYSLVNQVYNVLSPTAFPKLGASTTRNETASVIDRKDRTYTFQFQLLANRSSKIISPLPVPVAGDNAGIGDFAIADVFANAAKIAAAANTPGAGIVIQTADLVPHGSPVQGDLDVTTDGREWFQALFSWMVNGGVRFRSTTQASAIVARTATNLGVVALPTNATAANNPTTGIDADETSMVWLTSFSYSLTVQTVDNQATQTFDVNVITA